MQRFATIVTVILVTFISSKVLYAQYSNPASLIVDAHSTADRVTNPRHTPDAGIAAALAWTTVRHRVAILTHAYTQKDMSDRLKLAREKALTLLRESEIPADEVSRIKNLMESITFQTYTDAESARDGILKWERDELRSAKACFGVVSFLGHGAAVDGQMCLSIPYGKTDLDIDSLRNRWRYHFLPVFVFTDLCSEHVTGRAAKAERNPLDSRAGISLDNGVAAFVREARSQQWPLDANGDETSTASVSEFGEEATDCKDLLAQWCADAIQIEPNGDGSFFSRFGEGIDCLSAEAVYEYSRAGLGRKGSEQRATPDAKYGIFTRNHIIAIANPRINYIPPAIPLLQRWYECAARPDASNTEIESWADEETGAVVIKRHDSDTNENSWVYADASEELVYESLIASRKALELQCVAKSLERGKTLQFQVELTTASVRDNKRFDKFKKRPFTLVANQVKTLLLNDLPPFDRLAITTIDNKPAKNTWPAGAELHLLSMRIVTPRDKNRNTYAAPWPEMFQFWYPRHVLCSHPSADVTRVSNGQRDWAPTFELRSSGSREELVGVGGPLYAQNAIDKEHSLSITLNVSGKNPPTNATICVLAGDNPLLIKEVELGRAHQLEFENVGIPDYFAILTDKDCVLSLSEFRIQKTSTFMSVLE